MNAILSKNLNPENKKKSYKEIWDFIKVPISSVQTAPSGKAHKIFLDEKHHTFIGIDKLFIKDGVAYVKMFKENKYPYKIYLENEKIGEVPIEESKALFENIK